ncbi:MAG: hypothetical protein JSV62_14400 [Promethearchaeota archaeon]|nr:MAG: hypothetical protein JSV62_14400 [Candidatus Lokiarchaeota archaeon]
MVIAIPRRKQKIKYSRKIVCKHLEPKGNISNSLQALCYCPARELTLGTRAYVCQVCKIYDPAKNNQRFSELYEESKKIAEKKIKEKEIKLEEFEIAEITSDEDIDLSIDEFEEEEEEAPLKFEKRKAGKAELGDSEEFADTTECPFCGEFFGDLVSHIQECEFAPDDVSIEDIMPSKRKKKQTATKKPATKKSGDKQKCPYCGKEFVRLGRHLNSCTKKPSDIEEVDEEEEEEED